MARPSDPDAMGLNEQWAKCLIEELVRCGVEFFVFSSGFRNAPLVLAAESHPSARCISHFDERGAAFFALGCGRALRKPAAWITTSGTAAANGYPAVVEADMDDVPMLCLTADRPPELRETAANQTIDQVRLFGRYVRWFVDMPAPSTDIDPAYILSTADQAYYRALKGPVQINCMFREPLVGHVAQTLVVPHEWVSIQGPYTRYEGPGKSSSALEELIAQLESVQRGLVIAGRLATSEQGAAALRAAEHLGWPLLPDVMSQVNAKDHPLYITGFELCLQSESFRLAHRPEAVLQIGGPFVSKQLGKFLYEYGSFLGWWSIRPHAESIRNTA